jgi:glycosyltransferase involved in cell wall biosynthesis
LVAQTLLERPDVLHFQWLVVPAFDAIAIALVRGVVPVVVTVHDTVPFNGDRLSWLQSWALHLPLRLADALIVHTESARQALLRQGVAPRKIRIIPHGPLRVPTAAISAPATSDGRWRCLLFGEIKHYKGVDLLIEAVGRLPDSVRTRAQFIVAGRPRIDLAPLRARISELQLHDCVEIRAFRQSDAQVADLLTHADCFVFPNRQIDASGVYFLVKGLQKWIIATRVGVFAEDMVDGRQGSLISPEDVGALADALQRAINERPIADASVLKSASWEAIGKSTRKLYVELVQDRGEPEPSGDEAPRSVKPV